MREEEVQAEKIILIDIKLTRGLIATLAVALTLAVLGLYLAIGEGRALAADTVAPQAVSDTMRQFYLTKFTTYGADADEACATGYHMASFWEIVDPSNLKYNTDLGLTKVDSGQGPPTWNVGWVRTGYSNSVYDIAGQANCDGWTTNTDPARGTRAYLTDNWTADYENLGVWILRSDDCSPMMDNIHVWCIED